MKVKLGDVVDKIVGNEDRFNTELEFYVAGEHIESSRIAVYARGLLNSDKANTLGYQFRYPFLAGDILFMTKNPYLRKCGQVGFDGICSIATFVIRTKNKEVLSQKYLAVLMQSDDFWNYLEANKSGSVNYFITWKTLEKYEFVLPEIDTQNKITDVVWGFEEMRCAYENLLKQTDELIKSRFIEIFGNCIENDKKWPTEKLSIVAPEKNAVIPKRDSYWLLNLDMIESNTGCIIEKKYSSEEKIGASTYPFDNTMVLYSKLRPYLNKVVVPEEYGYATTELVGMKVDESKIRKEFLANLLRGDMFVNYANSLSIGAKMPRMSTKTLRNFECIIPPLQLQTEFENFVIQAYKSKKELRHSLKEMELLCKRYIYENVK